MNWAWYRLKYDHTWGKAGVTVELGFGRRAQDFSYNDGTANPYFSLANVVQAYVFYNITDKIKLTAGKWATHIGYEAGGRLSATGTTP